MKFSTKDAKEFLATSNVDERAELLLGMFSWTDSDEGLDYWDEGFDNPESLAPGSEREELIKNYLEAEERSDD